MADRSYCVFTIYACPEEHREEVLGLLSTHLGSRLGDEFPEGDDLRIGEPYEVEELELGTVQELADDLAALSPDIAYQGQQDPKHEYNGDLCIQVPGLGRYDAFCNSDGQPIVPAGDLLAVIDAAASLDEVRSKVAALMGVPFIEAVKALAEEAAR